MSNVIYNESTHETPQENLPPLSNQQLHDMVSDLFTEYRTLKRETDAGSGSTLVAAKREGFGFIGVEITEEYIPIIEARTGTKAYTSEGQAKE